MRASRCSRPPTPKSSSCSSPGPNQCDFEAWSAQAENTRSRGASYARSITNVAWVVDRLLISVSCSLTAPEAQTHRSARREIRRGGQGAAPRPCAARLSTVLPCPAVSRRRRRHPTSFSPGCARSSVLRRRSARQRLQEYELASPVQRGAARPRQRGRRPRPRAFLLVTSPAGIRQVRRSHGVSEVRLVAAAVGCALLAALALPGTASAEEAPPAPSKQQCEAARAHRSLPPILALDPQRGAPRVFAMQFKEEVASVVSYDSFRTKIECMILEDVVPFRARGRPNVVSFNEDVGLATLATGTRGAAARKLFGEPGSAGCEGQPAPCGALAALGAITAAYAPQLAAYQARFPTSANPSNAFLAATDTLVRGFMGTFSLMAKRYKIYILGSTDVPGFTQSSDPADIATFRDPDLPQTSSVYVATSPNIYNEVFMWGPKDVRSEGPDVLRNVVASNRKVPLVPLEQELGFSAGPASGPEAVANLRPYKVPGTKARIGFATSLPAFVYGEPPAGVDPCSDVSSYYMRCLSNLGA